MFKNPFYYGERGCLWYAIEIALALFAIRCLIVKEDTVWAWLVLIANALDIAIYLITRLVERKRYYREDSFWLREDEAEAPQRDQTQPQ